MAEKCPTFPKVQLLLLTGVSLLVAMTTNPTGMIGVCEAFVGTPTKGNKSVPPLVENVYNSHGKRPSTFSLFATVPDTTASSSSSSSLPEGKLSVLQDVVKEMEARHQRLAEQSETSEKTYRQKLQTLERDLEESKAELKLKSKQAKTKATEEAANANAKAAQSMQAAASTIEGLERDLEEMVAEHASDLESVECTKDRERNKATKILSTAHQKKIEELQTKHQDRVDELLVKLDHQKRKARGLASELEDAENESSRIDEENESIIGVLQDQMANQQNQIMEFTKRQRQSNSDSEAEQEALRLKSTQATEEKLDILVAEHKQIVEDFQSRIDALSRDKDQLASDLSALSLKREEQVAIATAAVHAGETREETLRTESERLTKQVQWYWILAKLTSLASKEVSEEQRTTLSEENQTLANENESLRDELDLVRNGLEELLQAEKAKNQRTTALRQKLHSWWSSRRQR